ncbi:MAG TPA: hypothetical protein PKO06_02185 [Candidatus Ozemobacteraceae bacterium]|nr:hypothetical protein [Candidatus Ozemobacteraceae bacterium]
MENNKIQELVFSFMDSVGAKPVQAGEGIWQAPIPSAETGFFNGDKDFRFTFSRDVAEKHRDLELICEGSYLLKRIIDRLSTVPKVSRLFLKAQPTLPPLVSGKTPELRVITPGKVYYRQQVWFNFRVKYECDRKEEMFFSTLADPALPQVELHEQLSKVDETLYSEEPEPGVPIEDLGEDLLRLYLSSCRAVEEKIADQIQDVRDWAEEKYKHEEQRFIAYLEEQKRELQKKKENVCFHLYFFQKEEEIERMIKDLETEKNRKLAELKEKFAVQVEVALINAVIIAVPTLGVPAGKITRKLREGAGNRVAFSG